MSPSLRFLALAMVSWAGLRAATLNMLPGASLFTITRSEAKAPPIIATEFPPIEPIAPDYADAASFAYVPAALPYGAAPPPSGPPAAHAGPYPVYYAVADSSPLPRRPSRFTGVLPEPAPAFYSAIPALDDWPLSRIASSARSPLRSSVAVPGQSVPAQLRAQAIDRVQLSAWALLRGRQGATSSPSSLASGGTLGGSQAGSRLAYNFTRQIAATLRTTSAVGRRGGEVALGARIQPVRGIPVWLTAERRQRLGKYGGGRNAFALFVEGGVFDRAMPWRFRLDAYLQGGIVGFRYRDRFIDGGLTLTRPVYRQFSAGLGVWGGAQPGVFRVDAGPRVSMKVRENMRVHVDYRQRLAGNAEPGSGPAITLAGDF